MLTLLPEGVPTKRIETFLIEDFFQLPPVSSPVVHLELQKSPRIYEKI
jgi:hypothetical protein